MGLSSMTKLGDTGPPPTNVLYLGTTQPPKMGWGVNAMICNACQSLIGLLWKSLKLVSF